MLNKNSKIRIVCLRRNASRSRDPQLHIWTSRKEKHQNILDRLKVIEIGQNICMYEILSANHIRSDTLLHDLLIDMSQTEGKLDFDIYEGPDLPFSDIIDIKDSSYKDGTVCYNMEVIKEPLICKYTLILSHRRR